MIADDLADLKFIQNMYKKLPARAQGYAWKLVFSTSQHGFSLNSLYRKMSDVDSPVMLFIQDTKQNVSPIL